MQVKPHLEWKVPQKFYDLYNLDDIVVPEIDGLRYNHLPAFFRQMVGVGQHKVHNDILARGEWAEAIQAYLAAISYADAMIGRVLRASMKMLQSNVVSLVSLVLMMWPSRFSKIHDSPFAGSKPSPAGKRWAMTWQCLASPPLAVPQV